MASDLQTNMLATLLHRSNRSLSAQQCVWTMARGIACQSARLTTPTIDNNMQSTLLNNATWTTLSPYTLITRTHAHTHRFHKART